MTRSARQISSSGIYHIIFRGVNHCHLFEDDKDYLRFLELLRIAKDKHPVEVIAYCLMGNHVHLLLREKNPGELSLIMRRLLSPYASWFNHRYERSGALIANRYKSECVTSDAYLLTVLRYIHQNPVVAGMVKDIADYQWSSYRAYTQTTDDRLVSPTLVLEMFGNSVAKAKKALIENHRIVDDTNITIPEGRRRTEEEVTAKIKAALALEGVGLLSLPAIQDKALRDRMLAMLRAKGYSIRQIERATGVSRGIIAKCGYKPKTDEES